MPAPKARTRHNMLTTEAFRELAETALEELVENSATLELQDLATWRKELSRKIDHVSDYQTSGDGTGMRSVGSE
ncbi:MAG: hypothetical protein V4593_08110 [Pseudomonadota bacterium]